MIYAEFRLPLCSIYNYMDAYIRISVFSTSKTEKLTERSEIA